MKAPLLSAVNIARLPHLQPLMLTLSAGEMVGLIGPNGAGKTMLLRALAGLTDGPGEVLINGQPISEMSLSERARWLSWLPADRGAIWPMRGREVVALGQLPQAGRDEDAIEAALASVDALAFADRNVLTLSTGERARVLLARALVARRKILLLDEPIANLDPQHRLGVMDRLRNAADGGVGVIVALHDLDIAAARCDRLLLLNAGQLVADGVPDRVLTPETLATVFHIRYVDSGWQQA